MSSAFLLNVSIEALHTDPASAVTPLLAVVLDKEPEPGKELAAIDAVVGGTLARSIARRDFRGTTDETLLLVGGESGVQRVLLVGRGETGKSAFASARRAAAVAARFAMRLGTGAFNIFLPSASPEEIEGLASGVALGSWEYTDLKTPSDQAERRTPVSQVGILVPDTTASRKAVSDGVAIAHGQALARRLGMMPANVCTPDTFAEVGGEIAARHGMKVTVFDRAEMTARGMGSFLSVAQGTPQEPRLVTLEYNGGAKGEKPIVLIGKGLCFDTGGISIKPAPDMEWMKYDMSGAGGVMGAMETIGRMKLPVNVVGIIGSTTNMPSGTAFKPGDVVRASNGKTIEITNTDAEGRMVLADLLVHAGSFNPAVALDAATLTGAIVITLGHRAVGVFGEDSHLVDEVLAAGNRAGEPGWPLPLWKEYREQLNSDVADIKHTGGRPAGSITAAMFLREFVSDYPWVHLDVAGTAYSQTDLGWLPKGPTGTPVGTFVEFVRARARRG